MVTKTEKVTEISEELGTTKPPAKVTLPSAPDEETAQTEKPLEGLADAAEKVSRSIPKVEKMFRVDSPIRKTPSIPKTDKVKTPKLPPEIKPVKKEPRMTYKRPSFGFD